MSQQAQKLSLLEKVGYGFGDGASNLIWMTFIYWQLNFYTDVYGLATSALATMLLVTRTWDMFFDVGVGMVADRTKTRWGKFRPYLIWMAIPFGIMSVLTFTTPHFGPTGKLIYAYVTLSLMMVVYSGINIPYGALMGVISPDPQERTSVSSWRFSFAFLGGLAVAFFTQRLVADFGHGNGQLGYQATLGLYAVIAVLMFLFCFGLTRERVQPVKAERTSTIRDLTDLADNVPWQVLCLLGIAMVCFVSIRGAAVIYYFKYYAADAMLTTSILGRSINVHLGGVEGAGLFIVTGTLLSLAGTFLIQYVTPYTGRKNAFIGCMLLAAATLIASYWVRPDQLNLLYGCNLVYSVLTGPTSALLWAMFADAADYSEWTTGRRATGLVFSASGMSNKFGWVIGGALSAWLLYKFGYQANVAQTAHAREGIRILMALAPAAGTLICGFGMVFYRLEPKMATIRKELAEMRASGVARTDTSVPEILPFSWAAAGTAPIWLMFHGKIGAGVAVACLDVLLVALGGLGGSQGLFIAAFIGALTVFYFGLRGSAIAWRCLGVTTVQDLKAKEELWTYCGLAVLGMLLGLVVAALLALLGLWI